MRRGEGVVRRLPRLTLLVELVHGEIRDPQELVVRRCALLLKEPVLVRVLLRQFQPQRAHALGNPLPVVVP